MKIRMPRIGIPTKLSRKFGRLGLQIKTHKPEILLALGLGGAAGTVVLACKATTRLPELVEVHEKLMDRIHKIEAKQNEALESESAHEVEEEFIDIRKEKGMAYVNIVKDYVLLYAPSVALGVLSGTLIVESHRAEHGRYLGAVAAYNGAMTAFNDYRKRVREEYGEEADQMLRYGIVKEEHEKEVLTGKGKTKKEKEEVLVLDGGEPSQYARYWEKGASKYWDPDPMLGKAFLQGQLNWANHILNTRGYIFLNEVYDALGYEMTAAGALVGWIQGREDEPTSYVSFGSWEGQDSPLWRAYINGKPDSYLVLDFNVDGIIADKLKEV